MKRFLLLFAFLCANVISGLAQYPNVQPLIQAFEDNTVPRFEVFEKQKEVLGLTEGTTMKRTRSYTDKRGVHHDRYHRYYKNRKVIGSGVVVHSKGEYVNNVSGNWQPRYEESDEREILSRTEAEKIARLMMINSLEEKQKTTGRMAVHPVTEKTDLCYINENFPDKTGDFVLAYEIIQSVSVWKMPYRMAHYIHAVTGVPIASVDKILEHKARGNGLTNYYGPVTFDHDSVAPQEFHLRDFSRGDGIFVRNSKTVEGYTNTTSEWNYSDQNDKAAIDVLYGAQHFYDLLKDRFQYNSLDNQGFALIGNVNNVLLNNAYWDGTSTTYGAGDCHNYKSFTSLDVVGHEFAHGLTEFSSNLVYMGESGAINESISDIFGKALEFYTQPSHFSWIMGHKVPRLGTSPFRSMSNPNSRDQPDYYKGNYWSNFIYDVHTNSGVMNYWFYLLVKGGSGINERSVVYQVKPIGMDKALDIVFLLNTAYLTETSTYPELYEYSKILAEELYGAESDELKSVLEAWKAVGLPVFSAENAKLTLTGLLNGSPELNPFTCWQNPNPLNFSFVNNSQVIVPPDASVTVVITAQYNYAGTDKLDTLYHGMITLSDTLRQGQSMDIAVDFYLIPPVSQVIFNARVQVNFTGTYYYDTFQKSMKFIHQPTSNENFFRSLGISSVIQNICDHTSRVTVSSAFLEYAACESGNYVFEFEYTDGQQKISFFDTAMAVTNRLLGRARPIVQNPDLSMFTRTSDLMVNVYVFIDGEKYYIASDTLATQFPKHILETDTVHFNEVTDFRKEDKLAIFPCLFCSGEINNQSMEIINEWSNSKINDCIPIEDFYATIYEDPFIDLNLSKITGCVNTLSMIEPHLSLDVRLFSTRNTGNPAHRHGLLLYENGDLKTDPAITFSGEAFRRFDLPLESLNNNKIDMDFYLNGAGVAIDNIFIYDKFYTGTNDVQKDKPFTVTNPASDFISFRWKKMTDEYFTVKIYNVNGQPVFEGVLSTEQTGIDCSAWPPGFYKYDVTGQKEMYQGKLVVVR